MTKYEGKTLFSKRLSVLINAAEPSLEHDELAKFLAEPHALLGNRPPWDLLTDCQESEFERVLEIVRSLAGKSERHASFAIRETAVPGPRGDMD